MVGYEAPLVGIAAAQFTMDVFHLPGSCESELEKLITLRLVPRWKLDSPKAGSCKRALLFPHGKVDPDFEAICDKLSLSGALRKGRQQFPHEFTLFQDPDGCEVEFSWGLRCRDQDTVSVFPKNEWSSYSQNTFKRKSQKSTKVSSKKLDTFAVSGADVAWNETVINVPDQSSSDTESIKSSPSVSRGPSPNAEELFPTLPRSYSPVASIANATSQRTLPTLGMRAVLGSHMTESYNPSTGYTANLTAQRLSPTTCQSAVLATPDSFNQSTFYSSSHASPQQMYTTPHSSAQPLNAMPQSFNTAPSPPMPTMSAQHIAGMPGSMYTSSPSSYAARSSAPVYSGSHSSPPTYQSSTSLSQYAGSAFADNMLFQSNNIKLAELTNPTYRDLSSAVALMA